LKEKVVFYRVDEKPSNKVTSFEAPLDWLRVENANADFADVQIVDDGKTVKFGQVSVSSADLIKWFS